LWKKFPICQQAGRSRDGNYKLAQYFFHSSKIISTLNFLFMPINPSPTAETGQNSLLRDFFLDQLKDIYWAEQKLVKTLPKFSGAAYSPELRQAFDDHLAETQNQIQRIERAFDIMHEEPATKKCHAMKGIAEEGEEIIDETENNTAQRDVGLIFAGQKVEHYEIATYGALIELAHTMGEERVADILGETLAEEKKADERLTEIARSGINVRADREI
jgi:ferritin-like metal-binding protein YciE